jgi:predicted nucleic acid-binding protein
VIVADASLVVDGLLHPGPARDRVRTEIVAGPELVDAEVANALRRRILARRIDVDVADGILDDYLALTIERYAHRPILRRAWELRHNATIYDALYIALAEMLDAPLVTRDAKLADVPGTRVTVEVVGGA